MTVAELIEALKKYDKNWEVQLEVERIDRPLKLVDGEAGLRTVFLSD